MTEARDFIFGTQLGFAKARHKITSIGKSGHGLGLEKLPYIWGFTVIFPQWPRCPLSVSRASCYNCLSVRITTTDVVTQLGLIVFARYQPVSPPPTKRIKHERSMLDSSGRVPGRNGRVKPEASLGSARHRDGRTSTPRSVIVISDTEDDATDTANTLSVLSAAVVL